MHKCLLVGCLLLVNSLAAESAPTVSGDMLTWPDDGWYQVQDESDYSEVCAGGQSCTVSPGTYVVINHTTGERFAGIVVGDAPASAITVSGDTIFWPDDGWYQVQNASNFSEVCAGGLSCAVPPGTYVVINHSTGERFRNIVVTEGTTQPDEPPVDPTPDEPPVDPTPDEPPVDPTPDEPPVDPTMPIVVSNGRISWPDNGWYQVQTTSDYSEVCAGGLFCEVPPGTYVVINHTTGIRYENIVVSDEDDMDPPQPPEQPEQPEQPDTPDIPIADLSPLPNPPLTPAPGIDSEPLIVLEPITTISEFFPVRNPTRNLEDTTNVLDYEDFLAGPLPAVIYTPDNVNPLLNAAPYFENLNDVEAVAGELLTVIFKPIDPDGDVPGLYPESIPEGARYIDNLDGTRSLIWRPLQPEVGIHEFTITATDPAEPFYRTERTIRINVVLPADTSSIANIRPGINQIRNSTVRLGDPVVAHIKVTDPNGTVPVLELVNPPAGATVTPHYSEPAITILYFVPEEAGTLTLELLATDAENPALIASSTVTFEVLENSDFERPGQRLKDLASARDLLIGYAAVSNYYEQPDGALYADIAGEEFDFVTTENSLKWDLVNPLPGKFRWAAADNLVQQAKYHQQEIHGHTLVWYTQLPQWIKRSPLTTRETHMREYIDRVLGRYADDIKVWDVVNESFEDDGSYRNSIWFEAMGEYYIDIAFRQARSSAPDAILLYNDYDIGYDGPKAEATIAMLRRLKANQVPVDGVGFQMHLLADFDRFDEVAEIFDRVAEIGLDIYITELDVSIRGNQTEAEQATVYEGILDACLGQARCKAFQTWGFTDKYSWRRNDTPLILDDRFQVKPAYLSLQRRLVEAP